MKTLKSIAAQSFFWQAGRECFYFCSEIAIYQALKGEAEIWHLSKKVRMLPRGQQK
jgi:hypothetical protein